MPSNDDGGDEVEYSVFGNDSANVPSESDEAARTDPKAVDFGDGDDGCPKCGGEEVETDEIATSGTGLTKLFDVQNRSFVVVSCADCGYSELYKGQSKGNAIDFFVG